MAWQDDLQPASWRGVPFGVDVGEDRAGRNTAVQLYPFRESNPAWVEDLGIAPRATRIVGFLVGDDVAAQRSAMLAAFQAPGQGELVHPLDGTVTGSIIGGGRLLLRKDKGGCIEIAFDFLANEPGSPYPAVGADTQGQVHEAAHTATEAADGSFGASFSQKLKWLTTGAGQALQEAQRFGHLATSVVGDATGVLNSVRGVTGNFGRFASAGPLASLTSVSTALQTAATARAQVDRAAGNLTRIAGLLR